MGPLKIHCPIWGCLGVYIMKFERKSMQGPFTAKIIGLEHMLGLAQGVHKQEVNQTFPPYNILKLSDHDYRVEVAVAGFSEDELSVETKEKQLTISGQKEVTQKEVVEVLHNGIASRSFKRNFVLADFMEVKAAHISNGVLIIDLCREVPESQQFKAIKIEKPALVSKETDDMAIDNNLEGEASK